MTKYLYNGIELPKLPEWDKTTYPYAVIISANGRIYALHIDTEIEQFEDLTSVTGGWYSFVTSGKGLTALVNIGDNEWGELTAETGRTMIGGTPTDFVWTNSSLYYDGVLAYEATFPVTPISGVWKFNETVSIIDNLGSLFLDAVFTSNGTEYWSIDTLHNPLNGSITLRYGINDGSGNFTIACVMKVGTTSLTLGWVDEAYRYIDFGATPQTVTEEFYEWLTKNAVPVGGEPDEPETVLSWQKHDAYKPNTKWDGHTFYKVLGNKWVKQDAFASEVKTKVENCLTFSSAEAFTIATNENAKSWDGALYQSTDGVSWSEWNGTAAISSAKHNGEQRIYMRGVGNSVITGGDFYTSIRWVLTGSSIRCDGNIENLLDYDTVAAGRHPEMGARCFSLMFSYNTNLTSAPDLPATELTEWCYYSMFKGCDALTTAPELPATQLAERCYQSMFQNCDALTTAPELPATVMADICYSQMFSGCKKLTSAPKIHAVTLAKACFAHMFENCISLTNAPALNATSLTEECYQWMFRGCTALSVIPALPATTLVAYCYNLMFAECPNVKISETRTDEYQMAYRIPKEGTGTITDEDDVYNMFKDTGGTFTGTPEINKTYYTSNKVVPSAKEPIAYLYNGVRLPDINEVWTDKVTYPCAMITRTITDGTCILHVCGDMPYYTEQAHSTEGYEPTVIAPKPCKAFDHVDGSWVLNIEQTDQGLSNRTESFELIWTNVDVMNKDNGSVYFDASEPPVPVYA